MIVQGVVKRRSTIVVALVGHQPTHIRVITAGIHRRQATLLHQLDDQLTVSIKVTYAADIDRVRLVLRDFSDGDWCVGAQV
jgi:hypothetical protein